MTDKTVSNPRVHISHRHRERLPSEAFLVVELDWLKGAPLATCPMTEDELYRLAENAMQIAGIMRRSRP